VVAGLMAGYFIGGIFADRHPSFVFALIKLVTAAYLFWSFLSDGGSPRSSTASRRDRGAVRERFRRSAARRPRHVRAALGAPDFATRPMPANLRLPCDSRWQHRRDHRTTFLLILTGTRDHLGFATFLVLLDSPGRRGGVRK
jgi:hypothetical protein